MPTYAAWMNQVREKLFANGMDFDEWQSAFPYNFRRSFESGTSPTDAATRTSRFWWREQEKLLRTQCNRAANCWLPRDHDGECQPIVG